MDYSEFINYIKSCFTELMGRNCKVEIKRILKNNDIEMDALVMIEKDKIVSPTIYLENYFAEYENGRDISEIIAGIYETYRNYQISQDFHVDYLKNYENVKNSIALKIINMDNNRKLLKDVPHIEFMDLAIVFYLIINTEAISNATALIHNVHLTMWDIDTDGLFSIAMENSIKFLEPQISEISDVVDSIISQSEEFWYNIEEFYKHIGDSGVNMLVMTNKMKMFGAACILYDNTLKKISDYMKNDVYIIPSSVHEVILIPDENIDCEELNHMVRQINKEEVEVFDVLSDHVYKYLRKEDRIIMCR